MLAPSEQRSHRRVANVTTPDAASTPIDDDRKLELKTRWSRQLVQCDGSPECGPLSEGCDVRTTDCGDDPFLGEAL